MSDMKRYKIRGWECIYEPDSKGEWVRFEDADKRIRELEAEVAELKEDVESYRNQRNEWSRRHELQLNRAEAAEAKVARVTDLFTYETVDGRFYVSRDYNEDVTDELHAALKEPEHE